MTHLPPPPEDIIELALPDGPLSPAEDRDPFCSKLGGSPAWLLPDAVPAGSGNPVCPTCKTEMYLVLQMDCPREDLLSTDGAPLDRVCYVFCCNTRLCSQVPKGWRVIFQSRRSEEAPSKVKNAQVPAKENFWDSLMNDPIPEPPSNETEKDEDVQTTSTSVAVKEITSLASKHQNHFPPLFLHIEEELLVPVKKSSTKTPTPTPTVATPEEDWSGEQYEKFLPPGTDKSFNKFQKRVANYPRQCVRYTVCAGAEQKRKVNADPHAPPTALPFHDCNWAEELKKLASCVSCGQACRRFELQLMPAVLAFLPSEAAEHIKHIPTQKRSQNPLLSDGMEWGSIFVFTCDACMEGCQEASVMIQLE